jgi:hypothetical protein
MKTFPETFAERHTMLLRMIPRGQCWRGCIGIGLIVTEEGSVMQCGQDLVLAPNQAVLWHMLVELPERYFCLPRPRCSKSLYVQWASRFHARLQFGMPLLASEEGCDFRDPRAADAKSELIWSALSMSMTAAAVLHRAPWKPLKQKYLDSFDGCLPTADVKRMVRRSRGSDGRSGKWMPEAFIPFPGGVSRDLADSVKTPAFDWQYVNLSRPIIQAFVKDLGEGPRVLAPCSGT